MGQSAASAHSRRAALSMGYITSVAEPKIRAAWQMKEPTNWFDGKIRRMEAAARREMRSPDHKRMTTIVSGKGQIPIPKRLRDRMGLRKGQVLEIREQRGRLILTKKVYRNAVDECCGILKLGSRTDDIINELRGEAPLK